MFPFFVILSCVYLVFGKQYRHDYVYDGKTDAFYKFHIEEKSHFMAKQVCVIEGADLIIPSSESDIGQVHGMFKQYSDIGDFAWTGADGKHHEEAEIKPIFDYENTFDTHYSRLRKLPFNRMSEGCEVITRDGSLQVAPCYKSLPFVCKVEAANAFYDPQCDVYGKNYQYFENVGSCYKIPRMAFSWDEAYGECRAENAHLVVLNSELEHDVVHNISRFDDESVFGARSSWFHYVGMRARKTKDGSHRVFKTIFNQTLEEAGYSTWDANEPNNYENNEDCGSIFKGNGKYNDMECKFLYGFICEKEVRKE